MNVPFEELAFSPNKEFADRLSAAVGSKRFVVTRDSWPPWQRLVGMFGWRAVCIAAEKVEAGKRYPPAIELTCQAMERDALQSSAEADMRERGKVRKGPVDREGAARLFAECRRRNGV